MSERQDGLRATLRRWWKRWNAWRYKNRPLREFIYLDDTSVYSLYASRLGAIKSEYTNTLTASQQSEVRGSLSSAPTGVTSGGLDARVRSIQTQQSQVVSRAIVQSSFKELHERVENSLALHHVPDFVKTPQVGSLHSLRTNKRQLRALRKKGFIVDSERLTRGALLEIEVKLTSEVVFQFSSVMQALVEMVKNNPTLFGGDEEEIAELSSISSIIETLHVGLVPLRGRAVDYSVVVFDSPDDEELIVHNRLLENLNSASGFTIHPLFVVGVAEQTLFWKDIRRVLFAGQRFRVLCRVAGDGVSKSWVPLKLLQVLSSMSPDIGEQIDKLSRRDLFELDPDGHDSVDSSSEHIGHIVLHNYAVRLGEAIDISLSEDDIAVVDAIARDHLDSFETWQGQRDTFREIEEFLTERYNLELDPNVALESRRQARMDAGLTSATSSSFASESNTKPSDTPRAHDEYFLDSEFIAIYW